MTDAGREELMRRVREALAAGRHDGSLPAEGDAVSDPGVPRAVSADTSRDRLIDMLQARIEALGDRIVRCASLARAWQVVRQEAVEAGHRTGYVEPAIASAVGLADGEKAWPDGKVVTAPGDGALFDCDFSLTRAVNGIAETGSLVFVHGPGRPRLGNVAPAVHYAVLMENDLLPDTVDAIGLLGGVVAGCQVAWITGSSRTADIEGVLIRGAHGPRALVVLLIAG